MLDNRNEKIMFMSERISCCGKVLWFVRLRIGNRGIVLKVINNEVIYMGGYYLVCMGV